MADSLYLDGSTPLHRHHTQQASNKYGVLVWHGAECDHLDMEAVGATQVHVFDADALTAHDEAVRRTADQGEGPQPLLESDRWEWAMLAPLEPGQSTDEARVLAGFDTDGVFHRYCTAEQLARAFIDYATTVTF